MAVDDKVKVGEIVVGDIVFTGSGGFVVFVLVAGAASGGFEVGVTAVQAGNTHAIMPNVIEINNRKDSPGVVKARILRSISLGPTGR